MLARRVFADNGYAAASLSQIAELAGLRKASLYHHFPTKESLYFEVMESQVRDIRALVLGVQVSDADYVKGLDSMTDSFVEFFSRDPRTARLLVRELVDIDNYAQGPGRKQVQAALDAAAAFFKAGMKSGVFRQQDAKHLVLSIVGIHMFFFSTAGMTGDFTGGDIFSAAGIRKRKAAVRDQVRALVLTPRVLAKLG
jgi:TetR/AcrR family transcriptional regulator